MNTGKNRPSPVEGLDIYKLAIGPEEAFVLSRVDGQSDEREIALATGLADERVLNALHRLLEVGAIQYATNDDEQQPRTLEHDGRSASVSGTSGAPSSATAGVLKGLGADGVPLTGIHTPYDPKELDEEVDLDLPKKRLILDKYYHLDSLDHYEALGIARDVDRKAVKTAYYELVATIHPDKYFGKNLGRFRAKMEKCFERITQSYEVLSRETTRAEYDGYLRSQEEVANLQRALDMRVTPEELDRLEMELIRLAESTAPPNSVPGASSPPRSAQTDYRTSARVLSEQERRQALAHALRRPSGMRQAMTPPVTSSARVPASDPKAAADGLRQLYEARIQRAKQSQLNKHLQAAEEAMGHNDPVSACNYLRIAQQLAPDDVALRNQLEAVQSRANHVLVERLTEQARYEERHGNFEAAGRSFARAADALPSAELWESAARCALRAKTDLRFAAETAKKAIEFCPQRADLHTLLAEVYIEAQLSASAGAELERAARLAPKDDSIRELRRRLERFGN